MKKEATLPMTMASAGKASSPLAFVCDHVKCTLFRNRMLAKLSCCYTRLLAERVGPRQTLRLLHAQLAFLCLTFPLAFPLLLRLLALGWFALAVVQCGRKRAIQ